MSRVVVGYQDGRAVWQDLGPASAANGHRHISGEMIVSAPSSSAVERERERDRERQRTYRDRNAERNRERDREAQRVYRANRRGETQS